jgi:hypothetical protein
LTGTCICTTFNCTIPLEDEARKKREGAVTNDAIIPAGNINHEVPPCLYVGYDRFSVRCSSKFEVGRYINTVSGPAVADASIADKDSDQI